MNYQKYNDYELIYQVRENNEYAQDIMYSKYCGILKKISSEYFAKYNKYGAEYIDFLQEANIAFYQSMNSFSEKNNTLFYTFMIMCVHRRLISYCNHLSSYSKNISNTNLVEIDKYQFVDNKSNVEKIAEINELEKVIKKIIFDFPILYGSVLELRYNGFTLAEIARLLDISRSSVEYYYGKIKKNIYKNIKNYI